MIRGEGNNRWLPVLCEAPRGSAAAQIHWYSTAGMVGRRFFQPSICFHVYDHQAVKPMDVLDPHSSIMVGNWAGWWSMSLTWPMLFDGVEKMPYHFDFSLAPLLPNAHLLLLCPAAGFLLAAACGSGAHHQCHPHILLRRLIVSCGLNNDAWRENGALISSGRYKIGQCCNLYA